jgi:hypothetical protein
MHVDLMARSVIARHNEGVSARFRVRGPVKPIAAITISIAAAMKGEDKEKRSTAFNPTPSSVVRTNSRGNADFSSPRRRNMAHTLISESWSASKMQFGRL